jgi:hypothetical protein
MQINPNNSPSAINRPEPSAPAVKRAAADSDSAVFNRTDDIDDALSQETDVRQSEVARGTALVSEVEWPPQETIRRIASLLAVHLAKPSDGSGLNPA